MNVVIFLVFIIVIVVVMAQALWQLLPFILLAFAIQWIISSINGRGRKDQRQTFNGGNPYSNQEREQTYTHTQTSRNPNVIDVEFEEREVDDEQ